MQSNATDTRTLIKETAQRLFVQKGLSVSTTNITKAAGVSTGLLFHYFPTKEDLIMDLYADALGGFFQVAARSLKLASESTEDFLAKLRIEVEASWDWCLDNWEQFQYMELVEGAAIANQVLLAAAERIHEQRETAQELLRSIRQHVALRDLPDDLLLQVISTNIKLIAVYMHENPQLRYDQAFRDSAWHHYQDNITAPPH